MSQPITSKLALVASLMDQHVRADNNHLNLALGELGRQYRVLLDELHRERHQVRLSAARIRELEFDLRSVLDANERLVENNYALEISILDCPRHAEVVVRDVQRRLDFEVVDLTTDEELDEDDVEL